ncbi:hypothetical protein DNTS_030979 [Danionella cerebrum]|uniref:Apolipoprotein D n=1 Tax=Danionella cerebrum TaxID=2873325 RepID=A0A553PWB8_9TELE|nr:hypothetical protein DNTS_030979 [Danionella translucida]
MQATQVVSLTLLWALAVSAQSIGSGKCPQPPVEQNFDPVRYMGRWHEIMKVPAPFQKGECSQATYTLSDGIVLVRNDELLADGTINSIEGTAKIVDPSEPAKLEVSFFENAPPSPYWVLNTDHDNYTLVYSCTDVEIFHAEFIWIMSRSRTLPKETVSELLDILKSHGINSDALIETDQTPELCSVGTERMQATQVMSLTLLWALAVSAQSIGSGKCPQPPVEQNFDPVRYMGRWHEIMKVPASFQKGECSQATYTLSDGIVLVLNEELLADGTISSIEGTAKIVDPSEPAKLEVSFFEDARPGPYWVLTTDHDNYTLVYSCTDAEIFHVEFAWILSRSRTLPKETVSELLDILKSHGINSDALIETDQTPELCSVMS